MTTTSTNIAGVMTPLGGMLSRPVPGEVYDIDEITPTGARKRKRNRHGVYELVSTDGAVVIESARSMGKKYIIDGKSGVWRRYKGRNHFFPDDRTGPIPPIVPGSGSGKGMP